jgi:hypothetical protein
MAQIPVSEITEAILEGEGYFDVFQEALDVHLHKQYEGNRITGREYADVYLGAMQLAMQQAVAFALARQEADAKAELLKEQALTEQKQRELIDAQIDKLEKETELTQAQITKITAETWVVRAQVANNPALDTAPTSIGGVLAKEIEKLDEEITKLDREQVLLTQKTKTEEAQILDSIDGIPVNGVIGKEKELIDQQIAGFLRDAEAKAAKIIGDAFSVIYTTTDGDAYTTLPTGFDASDMGAIMTKLAAGVNVSI